DNPRESCDVTLRLPIIPPADKDFCAFGSKLPPDERIIPGGKGNIVMGAGEDALTPGRFEAVSEPRGKGTDQEALMQALTADPAIARKMVVVLKTEGMVLMPWLDKVLALVEAWYPGQEDGNAVANVLFGLRNPSGKLPMTFGRSEREAAYATPEQFPGISEPAPPWEKGEVFVPHYTEDLQVGYRWFEANGVTPLFPFGFGLSYTTFAYSGLSVANTTDPQTGNAVLSVAYTITNTGTRPGAEVSQVYLTLPPAAGEPSKRLVGFQRVNLDPGASQSVTVTIDSSAPNHPLSYFQPDPNGTWADGNWSTPEGTYTVLVGGSSANTPLQAAVDLNAVDLPFRLQLIP